MSWPGHVPARCTEEEFLALPESVERVELIDGQVIVSPSPRPLHQVLVRRLVVALSAWADARPPAFVGLAPLDVRLGPDRIVQPDLFVVLGGVSPRADLVRAVPELVIEVTSSNRAYDRLAKRVLYGEAGVREYWIVDAEEAQVEVVRGTAVRVERERVVSEVAAGLEVDVVRLFADL